MRRRKNVKEMDFTLKEKEREKGEGEYKENRNIPKRKRQQTSHKTQNIKFNKEGRAY